MDYAIRNATELLEARIGDIIPEPETERHLINDMVERTKQTHLSVTFREGISGGWKKLFQPEHKELFKRHDPDNWLMRLNYVKDEDW